MTTDSWYHSVLRVTALTLAAVLLFASGVVSSYTAELTQHARSYVATAVGVQVGVEPNELNVITARLTERERELNEREAALQQREIGVNLNSGAVSGGADYSTYIMSSVLFVLLVLILLNYALDFARLRHSVSYAKSTNRPA